VFAVVQSNADDIPGIDGSEQFRDLCRFAGILEISEEIPVDSRGGSV
jgi:hypothetical protein